jgi:hypothetical protein
VGTGLQNRCGPVRSRPCSQKPRSNPVSQLPAPRNPGPTRSHNCRTGDRDRRPGPAPGRSGVKWDFNWKATHYISESQSLDHTNKDMGNHYLWDVHQDFTLHSAQEDRIFWHTSPNRDVKVKRCEDTFEPQQIRTTIEFGGHSSVHS